MMILTIELEELARGTADGEAPNTIATTAYFLSDAATILSAAETQGVIQAARI